MQQASAHRVLRMHAWDILAPTEVFRLWVRPVGARGSGDEDAVGIEYAHCTVLPDLSRRHQAAQSCPDDAVPCPQSHGVCCLFWVCFFSDKRSAYTQRRMTLTVTPPHSLHIGACAGVGDDCDDGEEFSRAFQGRGAMSKRLISLINLAHSHLHTRAGKHTLSDAEIALQSETAH